MSLRCLPSSCLTVEAFLNYRSSWEKQKVLKLRDKVLGCRQLRPCRRAVHIWKLHVVVRRLIVCFCLLEALSVRSGHCRAMGCRIGVWGYSGPGRYGPHPGVTVLATVPPSAQGHWVAPHQPVVDTDLREATRGPPHARRTTSTRPRSHVAFEDGDADELWRGQAREISWRRMI